MLLNDNNINYSFYFLQLNSANIFSESFNQIWKNIAKCEKIFIRIMHKISKT